jgi:glycosyltransferase 2 family protein
MTEPATIAEQPRRAMLRRIVWPVGLSLVVLGIVAATTFDLSDFVETVGGFNPLLLALAIATAAARIFFGGWRFHYVSGRQLSFSAGIRGQLIWDFFSNVTPSAIGGGPFAVLYISRDTGVRAGDVTAWTIFCIVLDQLWYVVLIPLVLVTSLYIDVIPDTLGVVGYGIFLAYLAGLLVWVVIFAYATLVRPSLFHGIASWVFRMRMLRRFRPRVIRELGQIERRARVLTSQPIKFFVTGFFLTIGSWASRYFLILFVIWGLYDEVERLLVFMRGAALSLVAIAMPTPGGSGGVEALYVLLLGPLMPSAAVAPSLLVWRALGYYVFIAIGVFLTTQYVTRRIGGTPTNDKG